MQWYVTEPDKIIPGAVTGNVKYSLIGPAVSATSKYINVFLFYNDVLLNSHSVF